MLSMISHPECREHNAGELHPETKERLDAIMNQLIMSGMDYVIRHRDAPLVTREQLERVHAAEYLDRVYAIAPGEGMQSIEVDGDTVMSLARCAPPNVRRARV